MERDNSRKQSARSSKNGEHHLSSGRRSLLFPSPHTGLSRLRQYGLSARGIIATRRQEISHAIVDSAHGFPYSRRLESHKSCVNALAFSSKDGRFLASGGDDLRIYLWDFHQDDVKSPSYSLRGPKGNIFCLEFSATNRFIFAAGTCESIFKYDVAYLGVPSSASTLTANDQNPSHVYRDNEDSLRSISCHPVQDEIFMSASEDGMIHRYDGRQDTHTSPSSHDAIAIGKEVTDVKYHPTMEHLFVTSDGIGRVFLRDSRMAFSSLTRRSNEGIVQRYNTKITQKAYPHLSNPESSSVTFDKDGTKLAVTFLHHLPTIYAVSDPDPVAVLSAENILPDGTPSPVNLGTYSNSCTMKHGSFGGPSLEVDDMYAAGSDDFHCYIWKIPPLPRLMDERKVFSVEEWDDYSDLSVIAYTNSKHERKVVPVDINIPMCRLTGHNSIVNTALFHPHFLHVVTAGVEKNIILHSPTPSSPCAQNLPRSPSQVRELKVADSHADRRNYYSALLLPQPTLDSDSDGTDDFAERQTLSLFDHIIREEGYCDVFLVREWKTPDSSGDEGDNSDDEGGDSSEEEEDGEDGDETDSDVLGDAILQAFGSSSASNSRPPFLT